MLIPPKLFGAFTVTRDTITNPVQQLGLRNVPNYTIWMGIVKKFAIKGVELITYFR